jgi:biopolymer transport protein ExbB
MAFINFISDAGFIGWSIIFVGLCAAAVSIERVRALYFQYGMNTEQFIRKVFSLVLANRAEEAIVACGQLEKKPFARGIKLILEKADRDDEALFQAQDVALSEIIPLFTRRIHYLSMLANVATLMGLLGTIHGLILSFQAVAQADPAQKQALLATGISVSMYTTALGLGVAIPVMVIYSFLVSRQNSMTEQFVEKSTKLVEQITGMHSGVISKKAAYPDDLALDAVSSHPTSRPPSGNIRAA